MCGLPLACSHANSAAQAATRSQLATCQSPAKQETLTGCLRGHVNGGLPAGRCRALGAKALLREPRWHSRHALRHAWHPAGEAPCAPKGVGCSWLPPLPLHHGLHGLLHELQAAGIVPLVVKYAKGTSQGCDAPQEASVHSCLQHRRPWNGDLSQPCTSCQQEKTVVVGSVVFGHPALC